MSTSMKNNINNFAYPSISPAIVWIFFEHEFSEFNISHKLKWNEVLVLYPSRSSTLMPLKLILFCIICHTCFWIFSFWKLLATCIHFVANSFLRPTTLIVCCGATPWSFYVPKDYLLIHKLSERIKNNLITTIIVLDFLQSLKYSIPLL